MFMEQVVDVLNEAIMIAGSEAKLGKLTGLSQSAISRAKHRKKVSVNLAARIERAVSIPAWRFRPDIFPPPKTDFPNPSE